MTLILHDNNSIINSIRLENTLVKFGHKQAQSKYGYFTKDIPSTLRYQSVLNLINMKKVNTQIVHPVFADQMALPETDTMLELNDWNSSIVHPAAIGFSFPENNAAHKTQQKVAKPVTEMTPIEYLETCIFPVLTPALEEMLRAAESHDCFKRKRTAFDPFDFLVNFIFKNNPKLSPEEIESRQQMEFKDLPFVKEHWFTNPRPPMSKSLIWTDEEASLKVQAFWKGYLVRKDPEVQELREWQKKWRELNAPAIVDENENFNNENAIMETPEKQDEVDNPTENKQALHETIEQ